MEKLPKTSEVYSTDRPELYDRSKTVEIPDPKFINSQEYEEIAQKLMGHIPPTQLPRKNVIGTPSHQKHQFNNEIRKGKPWPDEYKDHGRGRKNTEKIFDKY